MDRKQMIEDAAKEILVRVRFQSRTDWAYLSSVAAEAAMEVFEEATQESWVVDPWFLESLDQDFIGDPPLVPESVARYHRADLTLRAKYDKLKHEFEEYKPNVLVTRPDIAEALKLAAEAAERGEGVTKQRYRAPGGHPPTDQERETIAARKKRKLLDDNR